MRRTTTSSLALCLCAPALFGATPALADCAPSGAIIQCIGDDTDGYGDGSAATDGTIVSVVGNTVVDNSTVAAGGDPVINLRDDAIVAINAGSSIESVLEGSNVLGLDDDGKVINTGTLASHEKESRAIDGDKRIEVENAGTITTAKKDSDAINVNDDSKVTNLSGAVITTQGKDSDAVQIDSGSIVNNQAGALIQTLGDESAAVKSDDGIDVFNWGTIKTEGEESEAIVVGQGSVINNMTGSLIETTGVKADAIKSDFMIEVTNAGEIITQDVNSDAIQAGDSSVILNQATGFISAGKEGVNGDDNVRVTNYGTILGKDDAVKVGTNTVIKNYGVIENIGTNLADPQDAIDLDSGTVENFSGGIIRSTNDAAIDFDEGAGTGEITNEGLISGTTAVLVDGGNTGAQVINNFGSLVGTAGLFADLGEGDDALNHYLGGSLTGGADFGAGMDRMSIFGEQTGDLAGGAVLDGGADFDVFTFVDYMFSDIVNVSFLGGVFDLSLDNGAGLFSLSVTNWEEFAFGKTLYSAAEVEALAAPAVPLPAGMVLMLTGLAGLGAARARRRA